MINSQIDSISQIKDADITHNLINNPLILNSRFILILAMLYITCSLAADAVAYYFVSVGYFIGSGASIIFPVTFIFGDVITEVYGYDISRRFIWAGLFCEMIFAILVTFVLLLPHTESLTSQSSYQAVYGHIVRFVFSSIVGDVVSSFANIYIMSKTKILLKGRKFISRSILSTIVGEFLLNIIVCFMAFFSVSDFKTVFDITISGYLLEVFYSIIFSYPAFFIILILKRLENRDAYDIGINYNIFKLRSNV